MSYNFEFAVSATVSAKTIEDMIRKAVEQQTGNKVASISFDFSTDYGPMDRGPGTTILSGCTVYFEKQHSK